MAARVAWRAAGHQGEDKPTTRSPQDTCLVEISNRLIMRDADPLLNGQRIIGRLEFDTWSKAI